MTKTFCDICGKEIAPNPLIRTASFRMTYLTDTQMLTDRYECCKECASMIDDFEEHLDDLRDKFWREKIGKRGEYRG